LFLLGLQKPFLTRLLKESSLFNISELSYPAGSRKSSLKKRIKNKKLKLQKVLKLTSSNFKGLNFLTYLLAIKPSKIARLCPYKNIALLLTSNLKIYQKLKKNFISHLNKKITF
jgi:hypothetical protein